MDLIICLWIATGSVYWACHIVRHGAQFGIIGELAVALPFCILFAVPHMVGKLLLD